MYKDKYNTGDYIEDVSELVADMKDTAENLTRILHNCDKSLTEYSLVLRLQVGTPVRLKNIQDTKWGTWYHGRALVVLDRKGELLGIIHMDENPYDVVFKIRILNQRSEFRTYYTPIIQGERDPVRGLLEHLAERYFIYVE